MYSIRAPNNLSQISLFVLVTHALLILWIILFPSPSFNKPVRAERLVVKTIELHPSRSPAIQVPIVEIPPSTAPFIEPEVPKENIKPSIEKPIEIATQRIEVPAPSEIIKKEVPPASPEIKKPEIEKIEPKKMEKTTKATPIKTEPKKNIQKPASPSVKKTEPIVEKKSTPKKEVSKPKIEKKEPSKTSTPPKKEVTKQSEKKVTKTVAEKPKPDPQVEAAKTKALQEAQEQQRKLIAAAQESLAKIEQGRAKMQATKSSLNTVAAAPLAINQLQIEALPSSNSPALTVGERGYRDELASRLKLLLKLPEHGDVQLKLTLDRAGKPVKVVIVKAASQINRSYVEKTLPSLKFPPLGNHFENMTEYTFLIQLSNAL